MEKKPKEVELSLALEGFMPQLGEVLSTLVWLQNCFLSGQGVGLEIFWVSSSLNYTKIWREQAMTTGQISLTEVETSIIKIEYFYSLKDVVFFQENMSNNRLTQNSNICLWAFQLRLYYQ